MLNKEEILKITLTILGKIKGKPIKVCNGYNKFSIYAYGEEILLFKAGGYYLKMERENKMTHILNAEDYKPYIRKEEKEENLLVLESCLCQELPLYKKVITLAINEAQTKNAKKISELKNLPLNNSRINLTKEIVSVLDKINIRTLYDFKTLGPLAIISILMSYKMNPTFGMLLKLESIDKQIPVFLLDEGTITRLKKFWRKIDELHEQ